MFNEQDKMEYIGDKKQRWKTTKTIIDMFVRLEPFEIDYNKDVYDFTESEAHNALVNINARSINGIRFFKNNIISYTKWAMSKNKAKTNVWSNLDFDNTTLTYRITMSHLKDRDTFVSHVHKYVTPPYNKLVMFLAYEGFKGKDFEEIRHAKDSDLNSKEKTIRVVRNGKELFLPVSDELLKVYQTTLDFNYDGIYKSDYLIKTRYDKPASKNTFIGYTRLFSDNVSAVIGKEYEYTMLTIWKSGMYDFIRRLENQNAGELTNAILKEGANRYGYTYGGRLCSLREEYLLFKEAFQIT